MTLLAPSAAILAAGLTLPVLLAYYLLKLRRRPVRISATYLWAQTLRELQVNVPLRWLRASWPLLLHLVILALLVLATGRPAVLAPGLSASRLILLIDTSASMAAADAGDQARPRARLDEAKARARKVIDDLFAGGGPRSAAIVAFAAEARDLTGFTADAGRLRLAIEAIDTTDQPGDLAAALHLADAMSAGGEDDDQADRPTVVLLSDGAFAGDSPLPALASPVRFLPIGPPAEAAPDASPAGHANLGFVGIAARRDYDDPAVLRVFARIQNASAYPVTTAVSLSLNAAVAARKPLQIPGAQPAETAGPLSPSQATITFEVQTSEAALITLALDAPDLLQADNAASMVIPPATRPRVLLVVPDSDVGEGSLLEDNLREMRLAQLRKVGETDFRAAGARELDAYDLIVFDRVSPGSIPPASTLSLAAVPPLPGLALAPPSDAAAATYFLSWDRAHPLMRAVTPDTVVVARPLRLTYDPPDTGAGRFTEIARGSDGPLIALLESGRRRHLVLAFDPAESTWPIQPGFTVFLTSAIDYLTARGEADAGRASTTASAARAPLPDPVPSKLTLTGPDAVSIDVPPGLGPGDEVSLGRFEHAGVYRIDAAPAGPASLVCVNLLDETESGLAVNPSLQISGRPVRPYSAESAPREVWPWLVAAAAGLLLVEWFLYAFLMRA